jgi:alpha-ribazole phosphatase CobZ
MKNRTGGCSLESMLYARGISFDALLSTALSMYIYDPAIGSKTAVRKRVAKELRKALNDINVSCLLTAALMLEETGAAGKIPGITREKYASDPVDLIADEILGQGIAMYLAGTRALFEFERLDKQKPGILRGLPPMLDDAVAGLIAGVMVKVCS